MTIVSLSLAARDNERPRRLGGTGVVGADCGETWVIQKRDRLYNAGGETSNAAARGGRCAKHVIFLRRIRRLTLTLRQAVQSRGPRGTHVQDRRVRQAAQYLGSYASPLRRGRPAPR